MCVAVIRRPGSQSLRVRASCAAACAALELLASASSASAEAPREAVVVRSAPGEAGAEVGADELLARVTGELAAAGFRVSVRTLASARTADARDLTLGAEQVAAVLLGDAPRAGSETVRCVVVDTLRGAPALTEIRVASGPDSAPRLALQVADVLRAKLAERALHDEPASAQPEPQIAQAAESVVTHTSPAPSWTLGLELGALALLRPGAWDTALTPALALDARTHGPSGARGPVLGARVTLAGYGSDVRRHTDGGGLTARQGLGLVEVVLALAGARAVTPELSAGLGVYGLGVRGESDDVDRAHTRVRFAPVTAAGAGVAVALSERLTLGARGQLCYATQKLSLRIADEEVARSGGTMFGISALLRVALR
jgi:opacity protein-like surface antigen